MSIYSDEAIVASVYFDAASTSATGLALEGTAVNEAGVVIASISAAGVLRWRPSQCGSIMIATGTVIRGFQPMDELGNDMMAEDIDARTQPATARRLALLMLHAPPGGYYTITHQDPGGLNELAVETWQRATTPYGYDVVYGSDRVQVFSETRGGVRLWRVPDWSGYLPADPANWAGSPARISTWSALDELADRAPRVATGTTAIESGVPAVVWSATMDEGSVRSGVVTIHAAVDDAGTTLDSYAVAEFRARRSPGGSPSLSVLTASEEGTFGLGTVSVDVVGNDVQVSLTYNASGTLKWKRVDETREVVL